MSGHHCHALRCDTPTQEIEFMCRRHWDQLPGSMQHALVSQYVPGQEIRKDPTPAYLKVAFQCIDYIADLEGLPRGTVNTTPEGGGAYRR